jgi:murein DD-endopeptidase MepM/ murein hydrolase activator NlpD
MLFQKLYVFNDHTFDYERLQITRREWYRRAGVVGGLAVVFATALIVLTLFTSGNPEENAARLQQTELRSELELLTNDVAVLEKRLERIHAKDNTFYRSILNASHIDPSVWNGGVGGAETLNTDLAEVQANRELLQRLQYKLALQTQSFTDLMALATAKKLELRRMPAIVPVRGRFLSGFGWRANPFHGGDEFHEGVDIAAPIGTPVYATGDGTVKKADASESGYGLQVEIDHGQGIVTKYAHLSAFRVEVGQQVQRGQLIALVGNTGYSTGAHLHYEVIVGGKKINPANYLYGLQ